MPAGAVFLSYASEDGAAAERIATALRSAGIEVWFDKSELRGGDAWDRRIREQIHECRLFIALISAHSDARDEGYFRREWRLAVERAGDMAEGKAFLVPVVIDGTTERGAAVPDKFRELQWTRLPDGETSPAFVERVRRLLSPQAPSARAAMPVPPKSATLQLSGRSVAMHWRLKAGLWVTGVVLAIALAYFVISRLDEISKHPAASQSVAPATLVGQAGVNGAAAPKNAIAVLPFTDLSEKGDQAYLADGMAEELAGLLGKLSSVRVIGTTSSFRFRERSVDTRSVAAQLGASYLVRGSVRRSGDRIRVSAQLLEGRSGEQRWSDTYDRSVRDFITVQEDIATSVARALQLTVTADVAARQSVKSPEAYDLYLKGLHASDLGTRESMEEAVADYQQALGADPAYAPAAVELAEAFLAMGISEWAPNRDALERARQAALRALRLDPKLGTAHAEMSRIHLYGRDWDAAQREVLEAQKFGAQEDWRTAETAAALSANAGKWSEAIRLGKAGLATDPLNADLYGSLAENVYVRCGRFAEAESALRREIEISPHFTSTHYYLGLTLMLQGRLDEALAAMQQETVEDGQFEGSALVYHAMGRKAESDAALRYAIEQNSEDWPSGVARVYAFRGELDQAMRWLEHAYSVGDLDLFIIKNDPLLKKLEGDPRYKAFLRKMNLPE
jgi:TolB-like protein/Flp pilus assembly protein TadD